MGWVGVGGVTHIVKDPDSVKKRKCYCDGVAVKSRSDNSVRKLFIIALILDVPE